MSKSDALETRAITREDKKVLSATLVGTAIEWYDFFIYAQAASLIFAPMFFAPLVDDKPGLSQLLAFVTVGISFLFRPLGAVVCGYLGDKIGRKAVLVITLVLMGSATVLIGLLPSYAQIGVWAPVLLVLLRVIQGFSAGGEWGGAALMAVEHAPLNKRSLFGAFPQVGVPLGMVLATGVLLAVTLAVGREQFVEWGWRIPFLFSVVLILVGTFIRRTVEESPVFEQMHKRRKESAMPLADLLRHHRKPIVLSALTFVANNAAGYILLAFVLSYGQKSVGLSAPDVLTISTIAAAGWIVFTLLGGMLGDRIGRVRTFQLGYVLLALWAIPMWWLIDSKSHALFLVAAVGLTVPLGITYGPQAALYAELFPARVRYSGVSISYALGSILGGAFAPTIAQALMTTFNQSWTVGLYLLVLSIISIVSVSRIKDPMGVDLNIKEVHVENLRAHPEAARRDPGVAGEPVA